MGFVDWVIYIFLGCQEYGNGWAEAGRAAWGRMILRRLEMLGRGRDAMEESLGHARTDVGMFGRYTDMGMPRKE